MAYDTRVEDFRSGDALFVFDDELRIRSWNPAAEELTGVPHEDAVGLRCWEVMGATEEDGSLVCHAGCSSARLAREGWPVRSRCLTIKTSTGRRRVTLSTIALRDPDEPLFVHVMHDAPEPAAETTIGGEIDLTPRELQVLELLSDGRSAKEIATELGLAVPTVRNHIRGVLLELGVHSQLAALAKARLHGLLPR